MLYNGPVVTESFVCVRERGSEGERENMHMCWKGGRVHIIVWKEKSGYINSISDF